MQQARTQKSAAAQLETPRSENGRAMQIAGLRYHYADEPWKGLAEQWQRFVSHMGKIPGQVGRTAYGVNFLLPNGVGYLAGVESTKLARASQIVNSGLDSPIKDIGF